MSSKKKVALVTGATSGIGRACAVGLYKSGYAVAVCGRREDKLQQTLEATGSEDCFGAVCDVRDPDAVRAFFTKLKDRFGRLDVVFNNAGRSAEAMPVGDMSDEIWQDMLATNLSGAFYVAREAFNLMRDQYPQGGRIVNNGSISAHTPRPDAVAYNATKHAISGLTKSLSLDGRPYNIACGQIDIGNTATDMTSGMNKGMLQADGSIKPEPTFDVQHVVDALVYMAGLPLNANVQTITVMATHMPYVGRG